MDKKVEKDIYYILWLLERSHKISYVYLGF